MTVNEGEGILEDTIYYLPLILPLITDNKYYIIYKIVIKGSVFLLPNPGMYPLPSFALCHNSGNLVKFIHGKLK